MGFKKKRFTNVKDGVQVRVLDVNVTDLSSDTEGRGLVLFSDTKNTVYMAMESKQFKEEFVEGFKTKVELGLEVAPIVEEADTFIEKVKEVVDDVTDAVDEVLDKAEAIVDELGEGVSDIIEDVKETVEDIKEIIEEEDTVAVEKASKKKSKKK